MPQYPQTKFDRALDRAIARAYKESPEGKAALDRHFEKVREWEAQKAGATNDPQ